MGIAACEGFFGRLKNEQFDARDWLNTTIDEFIAALDVYIRWYGETRIKMPLGSRSPMEPASPWESLSNPSKFSAAPPGGQFWMSLEHSPRSAPHEQLASRERVAGPD